MQKSMARRPKNSIENLVLLPISLPFKNFYDPKSFLEIFSHRNAQQKKKNRTRKAKEEGRRERKRNVKVETALTFLNPKILFSVRVRTSDSYILYIEQKETKSARRMNDVFGQCLFLIARQWAESG